MTKVVTIVAKFVTTGINKNNNNNNNNKISNNNNRDDVDELR